MVGFADDTTCIQNRLTEDMFVRVILLFASLTSYELTLALAPYQRSSSSSLSSRVSSFNTWKSCTSPIVCAPSSGLSRIEANSFHCQNEAIPSFDPLECSASWDVDQTQRHFMVRHHPPRQRTPFSIALGTTPVLAVTVCPDASLAAPWSTIAPLSTGEFNPDSFRPVCATSDSFYRFLQATTRAVVGEENFSEYGPLIAGGLLRIRLELCVVESFFNEAVGPFVKENGLSWIFPLHETVETFLAGTIFALATTFILVGSTKLIQIITFYGDLIVGGPSRLLGGFFFDRARGEPVTLDVSFFGLWKTRVVGPPVELTEESKKKGFDRQHEGKLLNFDNVKGADVPLLIVSGAVKVVGETSKILREFIEALDLFVGRYLVLLASGYIIIKFVHFKIFPDFP